MKKELFLQLFAEDGGAEGAEAQGTDKNTEKAEQKPSEAKQGEKKYDDADLDRILGQKFAEWQKKQQKAVDDAKAKEKEAAKLEKMDAQQKAEYKLAEAEKRIAEFEKKETLAEMTRTARKMLEDAQINIKDDLLSVLVSTDAETTKAAVDGFTKLFKEAVEDAVKGRLKGEPPRKGVSSGSAPMTKAQILAIKDPEQRQKKMLEHRDLFNF